MEVSEAHERIVGPAFQAEETAGVFQDQKGSSVAGMSE